MSAALRRRDRQWSESHTELRWSRLYCRHAKTNAHRHEKRATKRAERRASEATIADSAAGYLHPAEVSLIEHDAGEYVETLEDRVNFAVFSGLVDAMLAEDVD